MRRNHALEWTICSRRKAREQENSKKKLSIYINTQFVLVSSSQCLKKIINLNKKLLESNAEQEKVKKNLSADVAEKIFKPVY